MKSVILPLTCSEHQSLINFTVRISCMEELAEFYNKLFVVT